MISDHSRMNREIKDLAASLKITLNDSAGPDKNQLKDPLSADKGPSFDLAYIEQMLADHQRAIQLFEKERGIGPASIRSFADKTLPVLQEHLKLAADIREQLIAKSQQSGK